MKTIQEIDACVDDSRRKMEKCYNEHVDSVKQFVGNHYMEGGSEKKMPTNLLELGVTIYEHLLAARAPMCLVKTDTPELKPFAADMQIVLNQIPKEIKLQKTIQAAVKNALFSYGVVKVGIAGCDPRPNVGDEPFVSLVHVGDYFVDMSARSWDEVQFEGNQYWMDTETIQKVYGVSLASDDYSGDSERGVKEANSISSGEARAPLYARVLLRDVYLVKENVLVTYAVQSKTEIRRIPWDGPCGSPYVKLGYSEVPGNLLPLSPVAIWKDMNELANSIYRKLAKQAVAKKNIAGVIGGTDQEINRIKNAKDGDAVNVSGAKIENMSLGGIDNTSLAFFLQNRDLFSLLAGNLDALGGLSPQSETAAQDRLITEAASARIKSMADATIEFAKEIFTRLAWYMWTDPVRVRKYRKVGSEKFNIGLNKVWTPETRDGDFLDYNFDIAVFSMQDDSPSTRLQKLGNIFNTFIFPMMQEFQAQGARINLKAVLEYIGENANMSELSSFVEFMDQPPPMANGPQQMAMGLPQPSYVSTKAPVTRRVYERVNRPGAMTERGKTAVLMQALMGQKVQGDEMAGINIGRAQ